MGTGLNVAGNPVDSVENVHHVCPSEHWCFVWLTGQGLAGFNPFAGMQGMNNMYDPNAVCAVA